MIKEYIEKIKNKSRGDIKTYEEMIRFGDSLEIDCPKSCTKYLYVYTKYKMLLSDYRMIQDDDRISSVCEDLVREELAKLIDDLTEMWGKIDVIRAGEYIN